MLFLFYFAKDEQSILCCSVVFVMRSRSHAFFTIPTSSTYICRARLAKTIKPRLNLNIFFLLLLLFICSWILNTNLNCFFFFFLFVIPFFFTLTSTANSLVILFDLCFELFYVWFSVTTKFIDDGANAMCNISVKCSVGVVSELSFYQ